MFLLLNASFDLIKNSAFQDASPQSLDHTIKSYLVNRTS